jgi:hypothetical protein
MFCGPESDTGQSRIVGPSKTLGAMHTPSDVAKRTKRTNEATSNEDGKDHKHVKTLPTTPLTTTKRYPIFDLPRELRDEIYHYAFQGVNIRYSITITRTARCSAEVKQGLVGVATYGRRQSPRLHEFPRWLRCTKQLRQEGLQQFYRLATFALSAVPENHYSVFLPLPATGKGLDLPNTHHARELRLDVYTKSI